MPDSLHTPTLPHDVGDDAFQIPVPGLFADLALGAASVSLDDDYEHSTAVLKLSLLSAWQHDLEQYRRKALVDLFREISDSMEGEPLPAKRARFEAACRSLGQPCPVEITMLLQQY